MARNEKRVEEKGTKDIEMGKNEAMNRANLKPSAIVKVYQFTSEDIKDFIKDKAKYYIPGVIVDTVLMFTKTKKNKKGYATARISFSDDVISDSKTSDWYSKIGDNDRNLKFIPEIYLNMVKKYKYDINDINSLLHNYKKMGIVEDLFGISEEFLNDIKMYITPKRFKFSNNTSCVIFSARVDKIIEDMLTNPRTNQVDGAIEIKEVYINKDVIHFTVYLHPSEMKVESNPLVKEFLESSTKVY